MSFLGHWIQKSQSSRRFDEWDIACKGKCHADLSISELSLQFEKKSYLEFHHELASPHDRILTKFDLERRKNMFVLSGKNDFPIISAIGWNFK